METSRGFVSEKPPYMETKVLVAFSLAIAFTIWNVPEDMNMMEVGELILPIFICCLGMLVFDKLVGSRTLAPWKMLHAVVNIFVALFSFPDILILAEDPIMSCHGQGSLIPNALIAALHIYHLIGFRVTSADWFHHILFVGTLCPIAMFREVGPVKNLVAFFVCGLPGGLDYILLVLVKHDMIHRLTEKKWNARINVWMRSPGCFACVAVMYMIMRYDTGSICEEHMYEGIIIMLLVLFNGQYYMQVVVGNTFRKDQRYSS